MFINGRTSWDDKTIPDSNFITPSVSADEFKLENLQSAEKKKLHEKGEIECEETNKCRKQWWMRCARTVRANFEALNYIRFVLHFMLIYSFILWTKWNNHHYLRVALVRELSTMQTTSAADFVQHQRKRIYELNTLTTIQSQTSPLMRVVQIHEAAGKKIWINEMNEIPMRHSVFVFGSAIRALRSVTAALSSPNGS